MENKDFIPLINEEEEKIVLDLINEYEIPIKNLHIKTSDNKYISGMFGGKLDNDVKNFFKYNHFIESINDLSYKTKCSIENCLQAYKKVNYNKFNPMNNIIDENEKMAYYFMENALFRQIILWDSLAQLYNLYFNLNIDIAKVSYKDVINKLSQFDNSKIDFQRLCSYICEIYDVKKSALDIGIHDYICKLRNQMTHRFSISITSHSENFNLRAMPDTLYRIAKDYNTVQKYLIEIIDYIIKDIIKDNVINKIINPLFEE